MKRRRFIVPSVLGLFLLAAALYGYRYWYDNEHYVQTDNAYVSGSLVQVGSPNAGRLASVRADVGQRVEEGMVLATVIAPVTATMSGSAASPTRYYSANNLTSEAAAPISGLVVARPTSVGDNMSPGQPILTLIDPTALWVVANVDEGKVSRVRPGQPVEVRVDMLGRSLEGTVEAITPATASLFSMMPAQNANGNFSKVSQVVPVKIALNYSGFTLYPGTSVSVKIQVIQ